MGVGAAGGWCRTSFREAVTVISSGAFAIDLDNQGSGQGLLAPYAPSMVASGPNYITPQELSPAPRAGGYAAIPAQVPLNAYAPTRVAGTPAPAPNAPAMPCNCNGNANSLQAIPWWGWALMAIGIVAIFRRVT